jgi:hypothetical protein
MRLNDTARHTLGELVGAAMEHGGVMHIFAAGSTRLPKVRIVYNSGQYPHTVEFTPQWIEDPDNREGTLILLKEKLQIP